MNGDGQDSDTDPPVPGIHTAAALLGLVNDAHILRSLVEELRLTREQAHEALAAARSLA